MCWCCCLWAERRRRRENHQSKHWYSLREFMVWRLLCHSLEKATTSKTNNFFEGRRLAYGLVCLHKSFGLVQQEGAGPRTIL